MTSALDLLQDGYGRPLEPRIAALLRDDLDDTALEDFAASLIVPLGGGRTRLAIADTRAAESWERAVLAGWSHPKLARFLRLVPRVRRMIDTDGSERAALFLDDLHETSLEERGHRVLCMALHVPSGEIVRVTRHVEPPFGLVDRDSAPVLADLVSRGASGIWGVRWIGGRPKGFLWVSESRWRGNTDATRALVTTYALPDAWHRVQRAAQTRGLSVYPDAMEYTGSSFDLTVGIVRAGLDGVQTL